MPGAVWTTLGVISNAGGVILLFLFGMPFRIQREGPAILWRHATVREQQIDRVYRVCSYVGLGVVILGLLFQVAGAFAGQTPHTAISVTRTRVPTNTRPLHVVVDASPEPKPMPFWQREVVWSFVLSLATIVLVVINAIATMQGRRATILQENNNIRSIAPFIVAEENGEPPDTALCFEMHNVGPGLATNVRFSCIREDEPIPSAFTYGPPIPSGGRYKTDVIIVSSDGTHTPLDKLRIRYEDALGYHYITEYRKFDGSDYPPRYRVPRLPGEAKPEFWSGEVSWRIDNFEVAARYAETFYPEDTEDILLEAPKDET